MLWKGLLTAEEMLEHPDAALRLKAIHALGTVGGSYRQVLADADLEARIRTLEERTKEVAR